MQKVDSVLLPGVRSKHSIRPQLFAGAHSQSPLRQAAVQLQKTACKNSRLSRKDSTREVLLDSHRVSYNVRRVVPVSRGCSLALAARTPRKAFATGRDRQTDARFFFAPLCSKFFAHACCSILSLCEHFMLAALADNI